MQKKNIFKDAFAIIVISSILGLAYNFYSEKSIPLIKKSENIETISEDKLFDSPHAIVQPTVDSKVAQHDNSLQPSELAKVKADTIVKKVKEKTIDNPTSEVKSEYISMQLVKKYINDSRVLIIDARSAEMFAGGHIGKSINIYPLTDDKDEYYKQLMQLPRDKTLIIYCDGGNCDLSHHVYNDLKNFGFGKIFIYQGGWEEWSKDASKR